MMNEKCVLKINVLELCDPDKSVVSDDGGEWLKTKIEEDKP